MNVTDFLSQLALHADKPLRFILPDGGRIPDHFHITEVGHVARNFVDCGGTRRAVESCLLQTWVADDEDHRLVAGKLARIFDHAQDVLPHRNLPVEIEYEDGFISQFPVMSAAIEDGVLNFHLGLKHTDCLARDRCLPGACGPASVEAEDESCCASSGAKSCC
jgi:Family of unknown function (DUF6428)